MGVITLNERVTALENTEQSYGETLDQLDAAMTALQPNEKTLVLASSTESSTKKFAITVDDDGLITATEIAATE